MHQRVNDPSQPRLPEQVRDGSLGTPLGPEILDIGPLGVAGLRSLQRTAGNAATQALIVQRGRDKERARKGGRSTERKFGKKAQRDKKPGLMGDPLLGEAFIDFWHALKQQHHGALADFEAKTGSKRLDELIAGTKSPDAHKTVRTMFLEWLQDHKPDLYLAYRRQQGDVPHQVAPRLPPGSDSEDDSEDTAGTGGATDTGVPAMVQSSHLPGRPGPMVVQRQITIARGQPQSAAEVWLSLRTEDLVPEVAKESVMRELMELAGEHKSFKSTGKLLSWLGGYEVQLVGSELLFLEFDEREAAIAEARELAATVATTYGIAIDSTRSKAALRESLEENKEELGSAYAPGLKDLTGVEHASWTLTDLRALRDALLRFAPILGPARNRSPREGVPQEIVSAGKVNHDVTIGGTMAETFPTSHHIVLYDDGVNEHGEEPTQDQKKSTFVHELSHGLLEHRLSDFTAHVACWGWMAAREEARAQYEREEATGSWPADKQPPPVPDITAFEGEKPPNAVAMGSAEEDLAESVALHATQPGFAARFPERAAIIDRILKETMG